MADTLPVNDASAKARPFNPPGTQVVGAGMDPRVSIIVYGRGGVGKTYLGRQLMLDADYGTENVLFVMAEDGTDTYGEGARVVSIPNMDPALAPLARLNNVLDSLVAARASGARMPKVVFLDSMSGIVDYQRKWYRSHPVLSDRTGRPDTFAAFGDLGYGCMDVLIRLRDEIDADCVTLVTTYEPSDALPEVSVEGKLLPRNMTRLSNVALYMKGALVEYDPAQKRAEPAPHRTIIVDEGGLPEGRLLNRYFFTQDAGEVMAKGHRNLLYRERAILPDVLRKIHAR